MAERRQSSSKSVHFTSLLKIWDLEPDSMDRKTLLETGGHSLMQHSAPQPVASSSKREPDSVQGRGLATTGGSTSELKAAVDEQDVVTKEIMGNSSVVSFRLPACTVNGNKMWTDASPPTMFEFTDKRTSSVMPCTPASGSRLQCCPHCGHHNDPGANWCIECGTALIGSRSRARHRTGNKIRLRTSVAGVIETSSGGTANSKGNSEVLYDERETTCCTGLELSDSGLCQLLLHNGNLRYGSGTISAWSTRNSPAVAQCGVLNQCDDAHHRIQTATDRLQINPNGTLQEGCSVTNNVTEIDVDMDPHTHHSKHSSVINRTPSVAGHLLSDCRPSTREDRSFIGDVEESARRSHRYWDTSGVYAWRKPSTIRSRKTKTLEVRVGVPLHQLTGEIFAGQRTIADDHTSQSSLQGGAGSCQHAVHFSSTSATCTPGNLDGKWSDLVSGRSLFLLALPDELLLAVLSFLSPRDLSSCMLVCWRMNSVASDPSLWRSISLWKKYSITDKVLLSIVGKYPRTMSFRYCKGSISVRALQVFFQRLSSQLKVLFVDTCDFGSHTGDMLLTSAALHCPMLCSIGVKWTQLSERAFVYSVQHCPRLEEVCLEQIPDISLQSVKHLVEHHGKWLRTLVLKGTPSTLGEAVVNLCAKHQVATLTSFAATFAQVEKHTMQQLTEAFPNLRKLEIYCTSISEEASFQLSQMALESLVLMPLLPLTAASVTHIGQMHTLKSIKYPQ